MSDQSEVNKEPNLTELEQAQGAENLNADENEGHDRRGFNKRLATMLGVAGLGLLAGGGAAVKSQIVSRIQDQMPEPLEGGGETALYSKSAHSSYLKA